MGTGLLINLTFLDPKPTGIGTYTTQILPALQGLNPTLLAPQPWPKFSYYPVPDNLSSAYGFKGHSRRLVWTQYDLPRIYHNLKAQLLFSPLPEAPIFGSCRSVVMVHDLIPLRFPRLTSALTAYFRYVLPLVLGRATHILCHASSTAREIVQRFQIPPHKITPIPLAYDPAQFRLLDLPRQNYFLYLGRPDPHKNLPRLLAAFAQLSNLHFTELWIVGQRDRRYTPLLLAQAQALGVADRVKFLDYIAAEDLPRFYAQAIALVFPSLWEGFGLPVLEAMACGTPVITSNLASLPEVAGNAALLVNPYQVSEIREAMQAIATTPSLWQHLHQSGLAHVQKFSWLKTGQATAQVLQQFL